MFFRIIPVSPGPQPVVLGKVSMSIIYLLSIHKIIVIFFLGKNLTFWPTRPQFQSRQIRASLRLGITQYIFYFAPSNWWQEFFLLFIIAIVEYSWPNHTRSHREQNSPSTHSAGHLVHNNELLHIGASKPAIFLGPIRRKPPFGPNLAEEVPTVRSKTSLTLIFFNKLWRYLFLAKFANLLPEFLFFFGKTKIHVYLLLVTS